MDARFSLSTILLAAALLLSGCTGSGLPSACAGVSQDRLANCVYNNAVMDQNPYYCYSIPNIDQRKVCISDAADPAVKKALSRSLTSETEAIFIQPEAPTNKQATQTASAAPKNTTPAPIASCSALTGIDKDSCMATAAIKAEDMSLCAKIANADIRKGCISDIARKTKDLLSCGFLTNMDDINLCNLYAKGEEAKG